MQERGYGVKRGSGNVTEAKTLGYLSIETRSRVLTISVNLLELEIF